MQRSNLCRRKVGGYKSEPEFDRLSNILKAFNDNLVTLFTDTDRVAERIREDIAPKVAANVAYQNAKENTPHTARISPRPNARESDAASIEGRYAGLQAIRR